MHKLALVLCDTIRVALWNQQPTIALYQNMSEQDWYELYTMACVQTVEAIVYDGLQALPSSIVMPYMLVLKWSVRVQQIEERNQGMNKILQEQLHLFRAHGIEAILQKGQGIAQFYPVPGHRNSGDIDWYFKDKSSYDKACEIGKLYGKQYSASAMDSFLLWRGLETEFHLRLVESRNPWHWKYIKSLEKKYEHQLESFSIGDVAVHVPAPLLNLLLVNIHILKHQITYGIGLRQFCDAAVLYAAMAGKYDTAELKACYAKLGISRWVEVFHVFLINYIGLPEDKLPFAPKKEKAAAWMLADVLRGGNFGFHDTQYADQASQSGRVKRVERLTSSFSKYVRLAPGETLVFPAFQAFNKLVKIFRSS